MLASRQINSAEQAYSASELEMLALVWATKYFRCYLYGKKFLVRTDHSALTFLHKFADNNSRLMRWSLRLADFDFEIEHIPGTKISHVDALSRNVGTIGELNLPDKQEMLQAQLQDSFCEQHKPTRHTEKSEFFVDLEGVLYRRSKDGKALLVVPKNLIGKVIAGNHSAIFAAHPGSQRTYELIALKYWWPKMRQTIEDFVMRCDLCQKRKGAHEFRAPLGKVEEPQEPFQITSMDITGPYPLTPRRNKYLLTFIDHFTKYVEAFPIPDQTAETCARVYATQVITRHGAGSTLVTDQGRSFISNFFKAVCKILRVKKLQTSAYHPISNGHIERFHRSLHDGLSHYVDATGTNWDVVVPFFLMAYRATPNSTTKFSPYYLLHGREMPLPSADDINAKLPEAAQNLEQATRLENLKHSLRTAYEIVRQNSRKAHLKNKRNYDKKAKSRDFKTDDIVYLFCPAKKPGRCQKFRRVWQGPFKIVEKLSELNYRIVGKNGREVIVHVNRLKLAGDQNAWKPTTSQSPKQVRDLPDIPGEEEEIVPRSTIRVEIHEPLDLDEPGNCTQELQPILREVQLPVAETLENEEVQEQVIGTPLLEGARQQIVSESVRRDPTYEPSQSPRSRRELDATPVPPPLTRSRARLQRITE